MTEFYTFVAQGTLVYLLGIQTLNVVGRHIVLSAVTSFILAVCGYYANAAVAYAGLQGIGGSIWWSYCLAGTVTVPLSIWSHPYLVKFYGRWSNHFRG